MKRVVILTTFQSFSPDYSLVSVVADQLRMLALHGYEPNLVVQEDFFDEERVPEGVRLWKVMPLMPLHDYRPGEAPRSEFEGQVRRIGEALAPVLEQFNVALTHDLIFLGWFLPHAAAIHELARANPRLGWLHWIHSAPSARPPRLAYPHVLRYTLPPNSRLVYLNHDDTLHLAEMYGTTLDRVRVVYNSRDPGAFFDLHPLVRSIMERHPLLEADVMAVYPFSTPRWEGKGVKKLLWLMGKIEELERKVLLVLVNAHANAAAEKATVQELLRFAGEKGLDATEVCFTSTLGREYEYSVPNEAVRQLFQLSNVFIFPSMSEGCSLVLLEAALGKNLLVLNRDVPSMREFGGEQALYPQFGSSRFHVAYHNEDAYWGDWARIIAGQLARERGLDAFRQVLRRHNLRWIFREQLEPLFYEEFPRD